MNPDNHYRYRKFISEHRNSNGTHPGLGRKESNEHIESRMKKIFRNTRNGYTSIEIQLYNYLDLVGIKYNKQKQIGRTRPDAFIPSLNLCIYADGIYWHSSDKSKEVDNRMNQYLHNEGFAYLRFLSDKKNVLDLSVLEELFYSGAKP